jgi:hypothetical protein
VSGCQSIIHQAEWPVWLGEESGDYASLVKPAPDYPDALGPGFAVARRQNRDRRVIRVDHRCCHHA